MKYEVCSGYLLADIIPSLPQKAKIAEHNLELAFCEQKEPSKLKSASLVFIGGRGLQSKKNYQRLKSLASKYGAVCACTRPVAMNGWESFDYFVGISGATLSGCTVVTFGVSGAGPLIKGIENASRIIAINNDKNALIFDYAHYGIVDDCMNIIEELEKL